MVPLVHRQLITAASSHKVVTTIVLLANTLLHLMLGHFFPLGLLANSIQKRHSSFVRNFFIYTYMKVFNVNLFNF